MEADPGNISDASMRGCPSKSPYRGNNPCKPCASGDTIYICIYIYVCIYIYFYICIYIYICMYIYIYVYIYICMYVYIYMYVCMYYEWQHPVAVDTTSNPKESDQRQ